jgi:NAD(P)-dependent dehydrogenase (short-subunit alcohol dehydrogenase family)
MLRLTAGPWFPKHHEGTRSTKPGLGRRRRAASPSSADARLVAVTSGGMYTQSLPLDVLGYERGRYNGPRAYARAKRAQVALYREWARRLRGTGVVANIMHPGWAATPGLEASLPGFAKLVGGQLRSPGEGADTMLWLAAAPDARRRTGQLFFLGSAVEVVLLIAIVRTAWTWPRTQAAPSLR